MSELSLIDLGPIDPARHRAHIAAIYAALPAHRQSEALTVIRDWPRLIHLLARAGELADPRPSRA